MLSLWFMMSGSLNITNKRIETENLSVDHKMFECTFKSPIFIGFFVVLAVAVLIYIAYIFIKKLCCRFIECGFNL